MSFLKSLLGFIWSLLIVAWRLVEIVAYSIYTAVMWIVSMIASIARFVWMFVFMVVGIVYGYASFGFKEGKKLSDKTVKEVENES